MKYTLENIKEAYNTFIQTNGFEPTAKDFDTDPNLPNSRYVQRNYNGLKHLRTIIGANTLDHTKGITRQKKAKETMERARGYEKNLCNALFKKYHDPKEFNPAVIRQFAYQQWIPDDRYYENIKCDVALSYRSPSHVILIDFFYPNDMYSFGGCIRAKFNKLKKYPPSLGLHDCTYEILFVCVNQEISQDRIDQATRGLRDFTVLSLRAYQDRFGV